MNVERLRDLAVGVLLDGIDGLRRMGATVERKVVEGFGDAKPYIYRTCMAKGGNTVCVYLYASGGADVHATDEYGNQTRVWTGLMSAAAWQYMKERLEGDGEPVSEDSFDLLFRTDTPWHEAFYAEFAAEIEAGAMPTFRTLHRDGGNYKLVVTGDETNEYWVRSTRKGMKVDFGVGAMDREVANTTGLTHSGTVSRIDAARAVEWAETYRGAAR